MKEYKNEFVSVEVQTNSTGIYTVQTYDNINSVYIYNNSTTVNIGINSPDYLTGTYYIKPNEFYVIKGNTNENRNLILKFSIIRCSGINLTGEFFQLCCC